jgi:hypothetical protein
MTQPPPFGRPASPSIASSTDFGATTISAGGSAVRQGAGVDPTYPTSGPPPRQFPESGARVTRTRGPRRARLQLRHINAVTVLRFSCVLAIALFFVWMIVIGVLYGVLDASGVIKNINDTVITINGTGSKPPIRAAIVFAGAAIVGVINIVLFVALATIGSVVYNLCADLVGGVEITLSER